jgi:tryptophan halogenase
MPEGLSALPTALGRLEAVMAAGEPVERLRELGAPRFVGLLVRTQARRLVRMGPQVGAVGPADLLRVAQRAAEAGVVPIATPVAVRRTLDDAARELRRARAWRRDRALWWQPLPGRTARERLWRSLQEALGRAVPPGAGTLAERRWRLVPELLPATLCTRLFRRLERRYLARDLDLTPGRVGAGVKRARTDEVRLLTGYERDVLERVPDLAVLVQWCLEGLAPALAAQVPERELFAPRAVMLARYPAPSAGFRAHFDNPGGARDNGRVLSCVLYLNPADRACAGGALALWRPGAGAAAAADRVTEVGSGSLVVFDARAVRHEVRPLAAGAPRWSIAVWLNETPYEALRLPSLPRLSVTEVLLPVETPPLAAGRMLRHELDDGPTGRIVVAVAGRRCRAGIVTTVAGEGTRLIPWCRHHLEVGFEHLVLVFDDLDDPGETATAAALREHFPTARLTVWSSAALRAERWRSLAVETGLEELLPAAEEGASPQAVASRQALNATAALRAARTDELGGAPLDWLVHLDGDELFHFHGRGRGGEEAGQHFSCLAQDGIGRVRYLNHELLLPARRGAPLRFKRSPRLAAARLGSAGWARLAADLRMGPDERRPYFHGYRNGKAAVAVACGRAAAGVHGWSTSSATQSRLLAGPSVLHFHFACLERLTRKLLAMAAQPEGGRRQLFEPCRTEIEALALVRSLLASGADRRQIRDHLRQHRDTLAGFTPEEEEILDEAGLLLRPELTWPLPVDEAGSDGGGPGVARKRGPVAVERDRPVPRVRTVGVLGGGTAGHLAALALRRKLPELEVTLIESPEVPVIGVGEATTPLMPQFLHADLGLGARQLFDAVRPTLKLGIRFDWDLHGGGSFNYPFGPLHLLEPILYDGGLDGVSLWSLMMAAGKVPFLAGGPGEGPLAPGVAVAYHLDNGPFVAWLRRIAGRLGVRRVECTIAGVRTTADGGRVTGLRAEDGRHFAFDLYLDCSGFGSRLLGEALGSPFLSYADSLFTDAAILATAPHGGRLAPYTRAEKMPAGWCWTTPQRREDRLGHVFSSRFSSEEDAWRELQRRHPGARRLGVVHFRSGRRREFWKGNVAALGNAYGFVEPLESTALHMLIRQVGELVRALSADGSPGRREELNRRVGGWWDYLAWFLALHYRFDARPATPFWRACAGEVDISRYGELVEAFEASGPLSGNGPGKAIRDAPDPLWGPEGIDLILLGQRRPQRLPRPGLSRVEWRRRVRSWRSLVARAPSQSSLLRRIEVEPAALGTLERAFREHGAAFPVETAAAWPGFRWRKIGLS